MTRTFTHEARGAKCVVRKANWYQGSFIDLTGNLKVRHSGESNVSMANSHLHWEHNECDRASGVTEMFCAFFRNKQTSKSQGTKEPHTTAETQPVPHKRPHYTLGCT